VEVQNETHLSQIKDWSLDNSADFTSMERIMKQYREEKNVLREVHIKVKRRTKRDEGTQL
jgi:hypothetical protein